MQLIFYYLIVRRMNFIFHFPYIGATSIGMSMNEYGPINLVGDVCPQSEHPHPMLPVTYPNILDGT